MDSEHILDHPSSPDEQKWERIWTTDEIRSNSANWSLAGDIGLFHLLNDFSYKLISRTHEMENEVDTLVHKTKIASVKINNVINDFHMLSNLQFVENRVYDEEVQDSSTQEKQVPEKTKEQREAEMLPKVVKAIELGLSVLEQAFDKINVDEISDSEDEEELSSEGRIILEPKDPYELRSLPYVIGSEEFQNDDFAGLKEYHEEEAAEVSGEDQTISESESSFSDEEDEPMPLADIDPRLNQMPEGRRPAESISDRLSSSDESELFGSERDEKDFASELPLDAKKSQVDQILNSNLENSERKNTRQSSVSSMQSRLKLPQVLPSPKREEKENVLADDGDLFGDEDGSDDESPFRKKTGLFKSDVNFNDDQDMFGDDLFGEKVKSKETSQKSSKPIIEKENKVQVPKKESKDSLLFGSDDSDDDMFSALTKSKLPHVSKPQKQKEQEPLAKSESSSKSSPEVLPVKKTEKAFDFKDNSSNSLFGDDSDGDDLFAGKTTKKKPDFGTSEEEDLFGLVSDKSSRNSTEKVKALSPKSVKKENPAALFDDGSTFDQPDNAAKTKTIAKAPISKKLPKLFDDSDSSEQETKEEIKESVPTSKSGKSNSLSLFGSEEDLFKQESSKPKPPKPALISQDDDFSLFSEKKSLKKPQDAPAKGLSKAPQSLFEDSGSFDLFSPKSSSKKEEEKLLPVEPSNTVKKPEMKTKIPESSSESTSTVNQKPVYNESIKEELETGEISFDSPVDVNNTLNVVSKNRVKVSAKRRKPTRKGRLAALQSSDGMATPEEAEDSNPAITKPDQKTHAKESIVPDRVATSSPPGKIGMTHKEKEKQAKNIMSQLMSEVAASKVKKSAVVMEDSDDEVDLFSSKRRASSAKSDFSFLSPIESNVQPSKIFVDSEQSNEDSKSEESNTLPSEVTDNEDFFTEPSFQGFRSSISHKASVLDFDDDDDDLFKSIKDSPLPKLKANNATNDSDDIFSEEANDIFADLQKEKYEMFPSQLYDDDDDEGDIFGTSGKPSVEKVAGDSSSKGTNLTSKKEPEKKAVDLFDDPLTGMLQE